MDFPTAKPLSFYDTFTRKKIPFVPLDKSNIRLYVCGPTVYDYAHIGNARPVVVFDVLYRLLKYRFPTVTYVRNITDVDDKINERAKKSGRSIKEITEETTKTFHSDMNALGALTPDVEPRATEHISQMIEMIENLIEKGNAYEKQGHVLFSVPSMPDYGQLSGRNRDEQIAGARVDVAPYKNDPADFILWKPSGSDAPGWHSPWGFGRPGWHIECSAMSKMYLGETFDIHAGGIDLIFPHHENEIAQSRCAFGTCKMANLWMHNGYVTVEGEKMSKSLGNFYTVNDLLKDWPGETIRYALLSGHYRAPLNYSIKGLSDAQAALDRLYQAIRISEDNVPHNALPGVSVLDALADDLNTPLALSELHKLVGAVNKASNNEVKNKIRSELLGSAKLLGLLDEKPEDWFRRGALKSNSPTSSEIEQLILSRNKAREIKDFKKADKIRDELESMGVTLEDSKDGTTWKMS